MSNIIIPIEIPIKNDMLIHINHNVDKITFNYILFNIRDKINIFENITILNIVHINKKQVSNEELVKAYDKVTL